MHLLVNKVSQTVDQLEYMNAIDSRYCKFES